MLNILRTSLLTENQKKSFRKLVIRHSKTFVKIIRQSSSERYKHERLFPMKELDLAIKSFNKHKCADPHGVIYKILQKGGKDFKKSLSLSVMKSFHENHGFLTIGMML